MIRTVVAVIIAAGAGVAGMWLYQRPEVQARLPWNASACPHGLAPREQCPFCTPKRIAQLGECVEHGVPEALCWVCQPALVPAFKAVNDWCAGHDCPESLCKLCGGAGHGSPAGAAGESRSAAGGAHEHGAAAPNGSRLQRPPAPDCKTDEQRVTLVSEQIADRAGVRFTLVKREPVEDTVSCNAELAYDANRFAQLASRVAGVVHEVRVDLGARVEAGDVLIVIDSPDLAAAKAEYLQAHAAVELHQKAYDREQSLAPSGVSTQRDVQEAGGRLAEVRIAQSRAEQRLLALGLEREKIAALVSADDVSPLLPLASPFAGEVVERAATIGEVVDVGRPLLALADTRQMWAWLDIADAAAPVRPGQRARIRLDGIAGDPLAAPVTWVSTRVDPRSRMLRARAELDNSDGRLRANLFGTAEVVVQEGRAALLIPLSAVQWDGCCNIAFVYESDTVFAPHRVHLGPTHGARVEVLSGLREGQIVVSQGSFLLKTELLKDQIGEGCCPAEVDQR